MLPLWLRKLFRKVLPLDKSNDCGYGPFKLPHDHPFTRACELHDYPYEQGLIGKEEHPLDYEDWMLFWRCVLIIKAEQRVERRMELVWDLIKIFPLARAGGKILWPGAK